MNAKSIYRTKGQVTGFPETSRTCRRQAIRLAIVLLLAATAYAQYGGGGMPGATGTAGTGTYAPGTPGYGKGKAIGIGVGAAAAGAGGIYFLTHRASKVTGCVESSDDGLHLTDDKSKKTVALVPGAADVKSGERLELKGKIKKGTTGDQSFLVKKVDKDLGQCRPQAGGGAASALNPQAK